MSANEQQVAEPRPWTVRHVDGWWCVYFSDDTLGAKFALQGDARTFADVAGPGDGTVIEKAKLARLRAELAETRAVLTETTTALRANLGDYLTGPASALLRRADARSVRGDAPAPAVSEQPAVVTQDAGEARRQALGIDGTMGDAQDVPHPYVDEGGTWASCLVCGLARGAVVHAAERRGDAPAPAEPPAAGPGGTSVVRSGVGRGFPRVHGRCPACRSASLFLAVGDHVTCASLSCPNPTAVADQLDGTVEGIAAAQAPAVELPVTLSSVDDVAAVCSFLDMSQVRERTWYCNPQVTVWAAGTCDEGTGGVEIDSVPLHLDVQFPAATSLVVAAIEAARGGSQ